ncbi:MAG: DUF3526 domain-containing protein, partial [Myxococcota bacterium]|nr:DUF3526 domain-containing protein [Myxococcota bacterium]
MRALLSLFVISLVLVTWLGVRQNNAQIEAQRLAQEHVRAQWDEMEPSNPHRAAHFGSYAFKPTSILNSMDEGINAVTGNVLRLEGHTQNDIMFSEASQSLPMSKFGKLKPSLLFQFLIPLFLIFLSFNTYIAERESGRLKLLVMQGASVPTIVFSKVLAIWIIGLLLLFSTIATQLFFNMQHFNTELLLRLMLLVSSYGIYYLMLICMTVGFSLMLRSATASMSLMIVLWVSWTVFLPKIVGNAVEQMVPLPTRIAFQDAMSEDREKGIDGHNPSDERKKKLEEATLKKYNVQSLSELPINFAGIVMQADEEYGNEVWDKHFGDLYTQLERQKMMVQRSGFVNPFAAVHSLSMGTAGTDMFHHLDFLKQAEGYRRVFIKTLNDEYAFGGSKTGERGWKADTAFFQSVKDFAYQKPAFSTLAS